MGLQVDAEPDGRVIARVINERMLVRHVDELGRLNVGEHAIHLIERIRTGWSFRVPRGV